MRTEIVVGKLNGRDYVGGEDMYGKLILKFAFKKLIGRLDWIFVPVDRVQWRVFVYAVMKFQFL